MSTNCEHKFGIESISFIKSSKLPRLSVAPSDGARWRCEFKFCYLEVAGRYNSIFDHSSVS